MDAGETLSPEVGPPAGERIPASIGMTPAEGPKPTTATNGSLEPKRTRQTDAFKAVLASYLVTVIIMVLNKYKVILPDTMQGALLDLTTALIDAVALSISGLLTHKLVAGSIERNNVNTRAAHERLNPSATTNIGKIEMQGEDSR